MPAPQAVVDLVEHFRRNQKDYRSGKYNETQVRIEFVDPLFKALGWDVKNEGKRALQYQDVIHEDAIKIGGATKAPDYSFRIGGQRKFFVEAKKPSINIRDAPNPAFQVRRYAWSAKLPISILTDFEEFAVYDCRARPLKDDEATTARVMYVAYDEYVDRWDEIESLFSRQAVLSGDFDKFVEGFKKARGTQEVDAAFLEEIERWREDLARNLALRNASLSQRELNFAVQRTIDRIIFLRIAEDRGIEPYNQLGDLITSEGIYANLLGLFSRADDKYNSGLFHFKDERGRQDSPDRLTPTLTIDDKVFTNILKNLYYPDSPYEFSVLPPDILGQVYEQFLGKVIRLTEGHRAKIEEKPEVKKAGGVYYTPTYIVDYIVKNTVGKLVEGKTPRQVSQLRILDPACGSGSFLIGAYQYLLDWHLQQYLDSNVKAHKRLIYQGAGDEWRLKIAVRKEILLNNIYGVDIDSQAVEVTKLSLLLKVLEGENQSQLNMFQERVLPDLANNIKCGNSLIGSDFYANQQSTMFAMDAEERQRINVFDWETEFKGIMDAGGFDAVIGNPPYRMMQPKDVNPVELKYYRDKYIVAEYKIELFHIFLQLGISLLRKNGMHGYIIPSTILNNVYAETLRTWIYERCEIKYISVALKKVFRDADVHTLVLILQDQQDSTKRLKSTIKTTTTLNQNFLKGGRNYSTFPQKYFAAIPGNVWNVLINDSNANLIIRLLNDFTKLEEISTLNRGLITGNREKYFSEKKLSKDFIPILTGADLSRYYAKNPSEYVEFIKPKGSGGSWDPAMHLATNKIIIRQIGTRPMASLLRDKIAITGNIFSIRQRSMVQEVYTLGIINSNVLEYFWKIMFSDFKSTFPQVTIFSLNQLPIRTIDFDNPSEVAQHDKIVSLVESMLTLNMQLAKARTQQDKTPIQRQIEATDKQIDALVYTLYDLTEEEIKIVEESAEG